MNALRFSIGLLAATIFLNSCIKQIHDAPPDTTQLDPNLPVALTISQLSNMALNLGSGGYRQFGDTTIYGIVVADDRSGNLYKQIVIEDSTGGIAVAIDQADLYNDFPVGRKVYVKLNGQYLVNYHGLPEIASNISNSTGSLKIVAIPSTQMFSIVIGASFPHTVEPIKVRITDLLSNSALYLNELVELENMEFDAGSTNVPYALPSTSAISTSRTIKDCPNTGSLIMYNSGYANFQPYLTPNGKGTITGIFSMYNTAQFLIRDTTDIKLTESRDCP